MHLSGGGDRHYLLWDVLMFQSWLEVNGQMPAREVSVSATVS
jgi:hypothetical protein